MKFAAVKLLQAGAGRAHREAASARAAAARAARGRAGAAGARVRAPVPRARRGARDRPASPSSRSTRRTACRRRDASSARRQLAKDAVASAPAGDLVGVVTFADEAEIVREAVRRIARWPLRRSTGRRPDSARTRYRAALSAAVAGARRSPRHHRRRHRPAGERLGRRRSRGRSRSGTRIEVADVGAMPANLGVDGVRAASRSRHRHRSQRRSARATCESAWRSTIGRRATSRQPCSANGSAEVVLGARRGVRTTAVVTVDDPAGLQADNARYAGTRCRRATRRCSSSRRTATLCATPFTCSTR